jgi:hypothetical protein
MNWKRILAVTFAIAGSVVALLASYRASPHLKVLDPRFHVLSWRILQGTNDSFFLGNQLEGRVRHFLRVQAHLPVKTVPILVLGPQMGPLQTNEFSFAILFTWDKALGSPNQLEAVLVDRSGTVYSSVGGGFYGAFPPGGNGLHFKQWSWQLDSQRTNSASYRLRLRLSDWWLPWAESSNTLAELNIKIFPAHPPLRYNGNGGFIADQ